MHGLSLANDYQRTKLKVLDHCPVIGLRLKYHDLEIWVTGYSRSFESLGTVSYSHPIAAVFLAVWRQYMNVSRYSHPAATAQQQRRRLQTGYAAANRAAETNEPNSMPIGTISPRGKGMKRSREVKGQGHTRSRLAEASLSIALGQVAFLL